MYDLQPSPNQRPPRNSQNASGRRNPFIDGLLKGAIAFLLLAAFGFACGLIAYALIGRTLDSPEHLTNRAKQFQTTRFFDRNHQLLNEMFDPNAGRRTRVTINRIALDLQHATIATEDANFYKHNGIDFYALARSLYYAVRARDLVSGGSTIPQQLVKLTYLTSERSLTRKVREAILAAEISRTFDKDQILEIYLNEIFYGNFAYGIDAAAETYFGKEASDLTLAESALLAGLPQAPAYYDPMVYFERARARQGVVLSLMVENGWITAEQANEAWQQPLALKQTVDFQLQAPHFTFFARQQFEELLQQHPEWLSVDGNAVDEDAIYKAGFTVTTSLDLQLQNEAERIVKEQVDALASYYVSNGALVSLDPRSGQILALVGSADYYNLEIDGQVNMALTPRQPGSTIKPLVYLATFEQPNKPSADRWTAGTLIADISEAFPDGANPPWTPRNYDGKERGLVTMRTALANSLNIPAVRALQTAGIPAFLELAQRLGITTLTRPDYGLSLSLGAGEVPLLEMTGAFAILANQGVRTPIVSIIKVERGDGTVLCEQGGELPCQGPPLSVGGSGQQVVNPVDAFLLSNVLSDNEARSLVFGPNSYLHLPDRTAAVKTGTTNDIRDILTVGYTPELVTGVWVGNNDNSPMVNVSGVSGAAPIWHQFMETALAGRPDLPFTPPPGVRQFEVCADTGTMPSAACTERRVHWFAEDRPPLPAEKDLYQLVKLDKSNGKLATEFTPPDQIEERPFKIYPEQYRQWAEQHGIQQPPTDASDTYSFQPEVIIRFPSEGESVGEIVTLHGSANLPGLASWEIRYGIGHQPEAFSDPIAGPFNQPVIDGTLGQWDTNGLEDGPYTLRLTVRDQSGREYLHDLRIFVVQPAVGQEPPPPTDTPVEVPPTPIPVEFTPTWTPIPVDTPIVEPTITPILIVAPTEVPSPLPTNTPIVIEAPPTATPIVIEFPPTETATATPEAINASLPTEVPTETATEVPAELPAELPTETPTAAPSM